MKKRRNRISILALSLLLVAGSALAPFMEAEAAKRSYAVTAEKEGDDEEVVVKEETDAEGGSDEKQVNIIPEGDKKDEVEETVKEAGKAIEAGDAGSREDAAGTITMSASEYENKINAFINDGRWRNGVAWGDGTRPKLSSFNCSACYAYGCDFSMYMYGVNHYRDGERYTNINEIRSGDVVRSSYGHTFVVLKREGNNLYTAEGNFGTSSRTVRVKNPGYVISGNLLKAVWSTTPETGGNTLVEGF
ncbi:MAG: hypothetical protein IJU50_01600, partial [Lachnospiraceae bacterium]|nr:hypothetical protein [Lachnospiraceae bacterium]